MGNQDNKLESMSNLFIAIQNMSTTFMKYQSDKGDEAQSFAKKIDKLTSLAKKRETYYKTRKFFKDKKKIINTDDHELNEIDQEENIDDNRIDTLTIVNGIRSSPAGQDLEFIYSSTTYLRQKNNEKVKKFTTSHIQDVRDSFLVRFAQDSKIWDQELRDIMRESLKMVQNVALGYNSSGHKEKKEKSSEEINDDDDDMDDYQVN